MRLDEIRQTRLDGLSKGLPFSASISPAQVARAGWNILREDLHLPLLIIKDSVLDRNIKNMARWCDENRFLLAPHGKTTMCPQIHARQMEAGAWAITVANASQALVCAHFGVRRILIANQLIGKANIGSLVAMLALDQELEIYCLVDSVDGTAHLADQLETTGAKQSMRVLIECGRPGWRAGVRSSEAALAVLAEIGRHSRFLTFGGVEAFEGLAHSSEGPNEDARQVQAFLGGVVDTAKLLQEREHVTAPLIFSIGGSAFLDQVWKTLDQVSDAWCRVIRSGCYVTHDHGIYGQRQRQATARSAHPLPRFEPALELWSYVQSLPDPHRAILTFGKRDCGYDAGLPIPLRAEGLRGKRPLEGAVVSDVNDQHAYMDYPVSIRLNIGDRICCGVSHPCTAFDKWRMIPVVDDDYNVLDLYQTYF